MKNLMNESWGRLEYHEDKNRLDMILNDSSEKQAEQMHNEMLKAVKEQGAETVFCDITKRNSSTDANVQNSVKNFKKAMENGLKRIAVLRSPSNKDEQRMTNDFVSGMNSDQVRYFDNRKEAVNWLEGGQERRKAA